MKMNDSNPVRWRHSGLVAISTEGHKVLSRPPNYACFAPDGRLVGFTQNREDIPVLLEIVPHTSNEEVLG